MAGVGNLATSLNSSPLRRELLRVMDFESSAQPGEGRQLASLPNRGNVVAGSVALTPTFVWQIK